MTVVYYKSLKSRPLAILFAFLLGGLGVHKFYLGRPGWGILYILFCWTWIPSIIGVIEAIALLVTSDEQFNKRFNPSSDNQESKPSAHYQYPKNNVGSSKPNLADFLALGALCAVVIIIFSLSSALSDRADHKSACLEQKEGETEEQAAACAEIRKQAKSRQEATAQQEKARREKEAQEEAASKEIRLLTQTDSRCWRAIRQSSKFPSKVKFKAPHHTSRKGHIIYVSGRAELMNGLGAMIPHRYVCSYNTKTDTLTHIIEAGG